VEDVKSWWLESKVHSGTSALHWILLLQPPTPTAYSNPGRQDRSKAGTEPEPRRSEAKEGLHLVVLCSGLPDGQEGLHQRLPQHCSRSSTTFNVSSAKHTAAATRTGQPQQTHVSSQ
jgi:hypothetical protein